MIRLNQGDETLDELYSTAWSHHDDGPVPSAADFLAKHPEASPAELFDVLLTDQLLRWRCGRPKPIAEYLVEHPSLADDPEAILKLVQGEFLARLDRGETPDPDNYMQEFPWLAEEIRLQCEVDRWLTLPSPSVQISMATTVDYRSDSSEERADGGHATDHGDRAASAPERPVDLDAPLQEADYEIVRPLGSGGMGEVYEAIQKSLRKRVALKLIKREALGAPGRVRRFFAEARAVARLRHPHIVGVHGIGRMSDGLYFLVMDLVEDGTTLASETREGTVSFDRAAGLVATVADAIEHAHSRGVIHRDLKPSNVLLDAEGRPHVTDFGLAKVFDAADPDNPQTTADRILGTPHYMAPEQADPARGPITPRTDVYALGGLLYALLTGKPPIQGDSLTAILTRVVSPEPVPTPRELRSDVPSALEQICRTCLEKDAEKRYPSAGAVAAALRAWLANPELEDCAGATADFRERTTAPNHDPDTDRARSGWASDRSLKDGRRTPNPGRWAPKAARSVGSRRRTWAAGAVASTLALLLIAVIQVQTRIHSKDDQETRSAVPHAWVLDAEAKSAASAAPRKGIKKKAAMPPAAAPKGDSPNLVSDQGTAIVRLKKARLDKAWPRLAPPADLVGSWEVHVYRPDSDGKNSLDLGNVLDTPVAIRPGDGLKIRAKFRDFVYAAVLAIDPDGSVQRLGAPADADSEQPTTELTIPSGVEHYVRLTDPGTTALVLLASPRPLGRPAGASGPGVLGGPSGPASPGPQAGLTGIVAGAFRPDAWRANHAEKTWIFDGRAIAPIRKTEAIEKTASTKSFATIGEALKANPSLNGSRAVVFEVAAPK